MKKRVTGVGAANIDLQGFAFDVLLEKDSNPGKVTTSVGGVTRNILEGLSRLGISSYLMSVYGNDPWGELIKNSVRELGIDDTYCKNIEKGSSIYLALMDPQGDMSMAVSDMLALEELKIEDLEKGKEVLEEAEWIVCDPCLHEDTIHHLAQHYGHKLFVDPVSVGKVPRIKSYIGLFNCVKCNIYEGRALSDKEDPRDVVETLLEKGVKNVSVTMGAQGVICGDRNGIYRLKVKSENIVSATGAGDTFSAGLLFGLLHGKNFLQSNMFGAAAALITLGYSGAISPLLREDTMKAFIRREAVVIVKDKK